MACLTTRTIGKKFEVLRKHRERHEERPQLSCKLVALSIGSFRNSAVGNNGWEW